jgi:hypothetical protein
MQIGVGGMLQTSWVLRKGAEDSSRWRDDCASSRQKMGGVPIVLKLQGLSD